MNKLQVFNFNEIEIRTTLINNEPYFIGKDVADVLGYSNTPKAIRDHVDDEDKLTERIVMAGQNREVVCINESGLYSLILSSKLPEAKRFKRWVTSEVLPAIRNHGAYMTEQTIEQALTSPDFLIKLATELKDEQEKRKALEVKNTSLAADNQIMKPKALFADAVETSHTSILIGDLAKLIKQNGVDIGQKRLFLWMRNNGYLIKSGNSKNMPTQLAMDKQLFEVKERTINNSDGSVRITRTPKVTGKGQIFFVNKFCKRIKNAHS